MDESFSYSPLIRIFFNWRGWNVDKEFDVSCHSREICEPSFGRTWERLSTLGNYFETFNEAIKGDENEVNENSDKNITCIMTEDKNLHMLQHLLPYLKFLRRLQCKAVWMHWCQFGWDFVSSHFVIVIVVFMIKNGLYLCEEGNDLRWKPLSSLLE